jgi:cysteine desulfurase family protein
LSLIYLDNAATSHPKPESVYDAVSHAMRHASANPGRSGHAMAIEANRIIYNARESIAEMFNIAHPERIIFTPNATSALNIAIKGTLKPGSHAITTTMEHNSVVRPLRYLAQSGVELTKVQASPEGVLDPADIKAAIRPETALIVMTHASNVIGTITPVEEIVEIAHDHGVPVVLDAAQSAGAIPIDVEAVGADFIACPGHKSLFGPQGTGFLYISRKVDPRPILFGGTGSRSDLEDMPDFMPDRYEAGTLNTPGIAGLAAGVEYIMERGLNNIRTHELALIKRLMDGLNGLGNIKVYGVGEPTQRVGVVSFNVDGVDPAEVGNRLDAEFNIAVRVGIHCAPDAHRTMGSFPGGSVRVGLGAFNMESDVLALIEAIEKIGK